MRRIGPILCLGIGLPACEGAWPDETFVSGAAWVVPQASAEDLVPLTGAGLIEDERNTISIYRSLSPAAVYVEQTQVVRAPFSRRGGLLLLEEGLQVLVRCPRLRRCQQPLSALQFLGKDRPLRQPAGQVQTERGRRQPRGGWDGLGQIGPNGISKSCSK